MVNDMFFSSGNFDSLHRAEELTDEACHFARSLTRGSAIMFNATRRQVCNETHNEQWHQCHDSYRRIDLCHQKDGDRDNGNANHNVIDEDDEERDLVDIVLETADSFSG